MNRKYLLQLLIFSCCFLTTGCAKTPNDVSLVIENSLCVTSTVSQYEALETEYSQAFPQNQFMPSHAPYCIAISIVNNNTGKNGNNIEVYNNGLTLSYETEGVMSDPISMIDYNAAGIDSGEFDYITAQTIGDFSLFDPKNCVTTIGPKVNILLQDGGSCTFYIQMKNSNTPVGTVPININLEYTNGNSSYNISTLLSENINLYIGGDLNQLYVSNADDNNTAVALDSPAIYSITAMTSDASGVLYVGDVVGNIYRYNGSWSKISNLTGDSISDMTADNIGDVYIATLSDKVYQITNANNPQINYLGHLLVNNYPVSMSVLDNVLFIGHKGGAEIFSCDLSVINENSCNQNIYATAPSNINQLITTNTLDIATDNGLFSYNGNMEWNSIPTTDETGLPNSPVNTIAYNNPLWIAGLNGNQGVFTEENNGLFTPLFDSYQATISGNVKYVLLDGQNNKFLAGTNMQSNVFTGANLVYLKSNKWTSISGINGVINTIKISSELKSNESNI